MAHGQHDNPNDIIRAIKKSLTPDLLKGDYSGHCYVASEAFYHLVGKDLGFQPYQMKVNGVSHWWLKSGSLVVDITASQFSFNINYWHEDARCRGFLTKKPSKRAQVLMDRVKARLELESRRLSKSS